MADPMTRRGFLAHWHLCRPSPADAATLPSPPLPADIPALYLQAMRAGIDPATLSPDELATRLAAATEEKTGGV